MTVDVPVGKYVIAVSGGVDSIALLDMVASIPGVRLTVAHYDHGIREDSGKDRQLVQAAAAKYGLPFAFAEGKLGPAASEATARQVRYAFLRQVKQAAGARQIITAHHQDDRLETAIINMLRGTGRRGLSSLRSQDDVLRPLLHINKQLLQRYAEKLELQWHEDSTNKDTTYLRNYVRLRLLPRFNAAQREQLLALLDQAEATNHELDTQLINYLHIQPQVDVLNRAAFIHLPHAISREVLATWLRHHNVRNFDRATLERLIVAAKTGKSGNFTDIKSGLTLHITKHELALKRAER